MRLYRLLVLSGRGPGYRRLSFGVVQNAMPDLLIVMCQDDAPGHGSQGNSWREAFITLGRVMGAFLFDYPVTSDDGGKQIDVEE